MANLRSDGMFLDGSNPENVDPVPALEWKSKDDFKEVVVHGIRVSPAVCKLLAYLQFYKIPFTLKPGFGKKGSKYYKKMPVLDNNGRHLVPALAGSFDEAWENRITYHYQMSTLVHITDADFKLNCIGKNGDFPLPACLLPLLNKFVRPKGVKKLREKMEDPKALEKLVDLTEFAKEVRGAMGEQPFFHGEQPGPVDISFFGVNARYVFCQCPTILKALEDADLMPWWKRMEEFVPLSGKPKAMFEPQ